MNEAEWQSCRDPMPMLEYLRGRASARKVGLVTVALCHRIWHLLEDARSCQGVETLERFAQGRATEQELSDACVACLNAYRETFEFSPKAHAASSEVTWAEVTAGTAALLAYMAVRAHCDRPADFERITDLAEETATLATFTEDFPGDGEDDEEKAANDAALAPERSVQAALLRCIAGNPFRPLSIAPTVLATQGSIVVRMATAIYEARRWEDMPLLGDALEDAGCSDSDVLEHCRGPGPHARGCFVLDAVLGKS